MDGLLDIPTILTDIGIVATGGDVPGWVQKYQDGAPGSFGVTIGSALSSYIFCGRQTHIFGDEVKFVFDYATLIVNMLSEIPILGKLVDNAAFSILAGAGGNITVGIGNNASLAYFGPKIAVDRLGGPVAQVKTDKGMLGGEWKGVGYKVPDGIEDDPANEGEINKAKQKILNLTGLVVAILLALMSLIALAMELLVALKYPQVLKNDNPTESDTQVVNLIKNLDTALTSRILAIIIEVEKLASTGVGGVSFTGTGVSRITALKESAENLIWNDGLQPWLKQDVLVGKFGLDDGIARWRLFAILAVEIVAGVTLVAAAAVGTAAVIKATK